MLESTLPHNPDSPGWAAECRQPTQLVAQKHREQADMKQQCGREEQAKRAVVQVQSGQDEKQH